MTVDVETIDEVEALDVDAEPESEPESEPEPEQDEAPDEAPEPIPPPNDAEAEAAWRDAEKASTSYGKRITKLLEPHAPQLFECPLCLPNLRGYVDENDAGRVPDDVTRVVQAFLGMTQEAEYEPSPVHSVCAACAGLGRVRTGSRVPNQETLPCATCNGHGFVPPPGLPTVIATHANGEPAAAPVLSPAAPPEDADPWGSPRLLPDGQVNPNYGKMPQYKDAALP